MLVADARDPGRCLNLRTRLLLEAVARAEGIEVSDEDLDAAMDALAAASPDDPAADYRQALAGGWRGKGTGR